MVQGVIRRETHIALEPLDEDPDREPEAQADGWTRSSEMSLFVTHGVPALTKKEARVPIATTKKQGVTGNLDR